MPTPLLAADPLDSIRWRIFVPAMSLCRRELVRFVRQRLRLVVSVGTPIIFWLFICAGMGRSFHSNLPGGNNFMEYFFPGTLIMMILFTAIFSTISIIEDRREGFLQSVLVAPVSRLAIVLGKILGGTFLATAQGALFLLLAPLVGVKLDPASFILAVGVMLLVSFALTGLGFCIAWRMSSTQSFHAIMNLFLMPMLFLSGAFFPAEGASNWLRWMMGINPLTYGVSALRRALYWSDAAPLPLAGWSICLGVTLIFAIAMVAASATVVQGRVAADLQ
jgi:ABC-2 type transport system permease protein